MSRRRTNPSFMTNGEAERERLRLQHMVRGIAENERGVNQAPQSAAKNNPINSKGQTQPSSIGPEFWASDRGSIVKAIVINGPINGMLLFTLLGLPMLDLEMLQPHSFKLDS